MLSLSTAEAGREKLHFPGCFAVQVWVQTQVSTKRIPLKDVELGPELREGWDRLRQSLAGMNGGSQQFVGQLQTEATLLVTRHNPSSCWELTLPPPALPVILQATREPIANSCPMKSTKVALVCASGS